MGETDDGVGVKESKMAIGGKRILSFCQSVQEHDY